ncbi:EI24-domain-containing protein [Gonapodya prolifera JEL478]|uniref:EI24-domain-containing protein n=1 Tax=Gonapodya prolifera (strain JEL478) TaxID=1344416 RepID=A0A139A8A0_GONPJ|nr:EI24-domain-containing protein [Gonapodya prolifera JEL478]|eukprot:KXS12613.1 EI24-domain-containing protein [Gonapodya prolifera JEL478]
MAGYKRGGWRDDFPLVSDLEIVVQWMGRGVLDGMRWDAVADMVRRSRPIRFACAKSCLLNGILFLCSILLFDNVVLPFVQTNFPVVSRRALVVLFNLFWSYPLYVISLVISSFWYQAIADALSPSTRSKPSQDRSYDTLVNKLASSLHKNLVYTVHIPLCSLPSLLLPSPLGDVLSVAHMTWLISLYSFEYRWNEQGWDVERRTDFVEGRWAYFAGFGLPCALATYYVPQLIGAAVFALVFPGFIIMAHSAHPVPQSSGPSSPSTSSPEAPGTPRDHAERVVRTLIVLPNRYPAFRAAKYVAFLLVKGIRGVR